MKRHVQQELRMPDKNGQWRGGRRTAGKGKRLGRPPKGPRSSERHEKRGSVRAHEPVHVTCRAVPGLRLRKRHVYKALRTAMLCVFERAQFRVVHVSIQGTHVHLLVEARDKRALARGMQGLQISAAKRINAAIGKRTGTRRRGSVFADRYHPTTLTTPKQVRHALAYVLNNWRRHREDGGRYSEVAPIDSFATGLAFNGWADPEELIAVDPPPDPLPVHAPRAWLLRVGWRRHGLISVAEVPGPLRG